MKIKLNRKSEPTFILSKQLLNHNFDFSFYAHEMKQWKKEEEE